MSLGTVLAEPDRNTPQSPRRFAPWAKPWAMPDLGLAQPSSWVSQQLGSRW